MSKPTYEERCDLRWEIERHLGGVEEWTPSHDLSLSTFGLLRKCQRALVQPTEREPVVREELGTIHSHDKCGVIEGWMLQIARALGLDAAQGVTGSQVLDAIAALKEKR